MRNAWPLLAAWFIVLGIVAMISIGYTSKVNHFYGIAESSEIVVNSEIPVEIKRVNVVEGQFIEENQLLVELSSPELDLRINEISHQLEQLKVQKGLDKAELLSKIRQLQAQKRAKTTETDNRIKQLESRYRLNKELAGGLKSVDMNPTPGDPAISPIRQRIESLRLELAGALRPLNIQIELFEAALNLSESPKKIQVERLEKELVMLQRESRRLNIYARISGLIGSIHYKAGAKVAPFAPILTLQTQSPSYVKGYLLEDVDVDLE
jgi:multidrug resistance efflux pump